MRRTKLFIQSLMIGCLCLVLVACGGSSSSSSVAVTQYSVTATAGSGGAITPADTSVSSGQSAKFTIAVNSGYVIQSVTGCGGTLSGNTYTTAPVTANCAVNATFKSIVYTVTASAGSGGSISPPSATVKSGNTTAFNVIASSGYAIQLVSSGGSHLARPCGPSLLGELLKTPVDTRGLAPDVPLRDDFNGTGLHPIAGSGLPCLPGAHRPRRSAVALLGSSFELWKKNHKLALDALRFVFEN